MSILLWVIAGLIGLAALIFALGWWLGGKMAHSPVGATPHYDKRDTFKTPADLGLLAQLVHFQTKDGLRLAAWYIPAEDPAAPAIIGMHGGRDDKRYFLPLAPALHHAGFATLLIDGRSHGESELDPQGLSLGIRDHMDVTAGVDYLHAQGHKHIGAMGCSQGGACVVLAAANDPRIEALVIESSGYQISRPLDLMAPWAPKLLRKLLTVGLMVRLGFEWRDAIRTHGPQLREARKLSGRHILMMHGDNDQMSTVADMNHFADQMGPHVQRWVLHGGKHCILRRGLADYEPLAVGFLAQAFEHNQ